MNSILVKLLLISAIGQLGIAAIFERDCITTLCLKNVHAASVAVTKIDWKPISLFPEEMKRFKVSHEKRKAKPGSQERM
jgi:hypothetical protein